MKRKNYFKKNRGLILGLALLLILSVTLIAGNSLAKYSQKIVLKGTVIYTSASTAEDKVSISVNDDYSVTSTGNVDELIRAVPVLNWVNENGDITIGELPELFPGENWTLKKIGDVPYLFYNGVVEPDGRTTPAIAPVENDVTAPAGCTLQITLLAEAIQADPADAAQEAWGMTYSSDSGWTAVVNP